MERLLGDFFDENKVGEQREYIDAVVNGTIAEIEKVDSLINEYSKGWRIDRISSVSLAALRLGVYEIKYMKDIPTAVSVNEAVALAKEFEGEEAAPFVNGILGKLKDDIG